MLLQKGKHTGKCKKERQPWDTRNDLDALLGTGKASAKTLQLVLDTAFQKRCESTGKNSEKTPQ